MNRICCNIHLFHICEQKEQELKLISGFVQGIIKLETVRHIQIEQNRCAMACQGYDAVFFLLK